MVMKAFYSLPFLPWPPLSWERGSWRAVNSFKYGKGVCLLVVFAKRWLKILFYNAHFTFCEILCAFCETLRLVYKKPGLKGHGIHFVHGLAKIHV